MGLVFDREVAAVSGPGVDFAHAVTHRRAARVSGPTLSPVRVTTPV